MIEVIRGNPEMVAASKKKSVLKQGLRKCPVALFVERGAMFMAGKELNKRD